MTTRSISPTTVSQLLAALGYQGPTGSTNPPIPAGGGLKGKSTMYENVQEMADTRSAKLSDEMAKTEKDLAVKAVFEQLSTTSFAEVLKRFPFDIWKSVTKDVMDEWQLEFRFTGFSAEAIIKELLSHSPVADRATDLLRLILVFCERGTNISKMTRTMSDRGKYEITVLKNNYQIKDRVQAAGSSTLTLGRIAQAFPWVTCDYVHNHQEHFIISMHDMQKAAGGHTPPKAICCGAFGSLIHTDKSRVNIHETLMKAHSVWATKLTKLINKSASKKADRVVADEAYKYTEMAFNNHFIPNDFRIRCVKQWGIIDVNGDLDVSIGELAKTFDAFQ